MVNELQDINSFDVGKKILTNGSCSPINGEMVG